MRRVDVKITHDGGIARFTVEYNGGWENIKQRIQAERKTRGISGVTITETSYYRTVQKIEDVKKGEFIRLRDSPTAPVWIRDEYSSLDWPKGQGRYTCIKADDINSATYLKKGRLVITGFDY